MKVYRSVLLLSILFAPIGCGEEAPSAEESLADSVDEAVGLLNEQAKLQCACWELGEFDSQDDCEQSVTEIAPAQARCSAAAFELDRVASQLYLDCTNPVEREFNTCASDSLDCNDPASLAACNEEFNATAGTCIGLPDTISQAIGLCFAEEQP